MKEIQKSDLKERFLKNKDFIKCESLNQRLKPLPELSPEKKLDLLISNSPSSAKMKVNKPEEEYDDVKVKNTKKLMIYGRS